MTILIVSLFLPHTINLILPTSTDSRTCGSGSTPRCATTSSSGRLSEKPRDIQINSKPSVDSDLRNDHERSCIENRSSVQDSIPWAKNSRHLDTSNSLQRSLSGSGHFTNHSKPGDNFPQGEKSKRRFAEARWTVEPAHQGNDGLRNAVKAAAIRGTLKDHIWIGTLGMPTNALNGTRTKREIEGRLATEYGSMTVFCEDSDFDGHYKIYCKQILWPIFHYQTPDSPKSKAYRDHSWVYYVKVNQAFADKIIHNWKQEDIIWIHDYHLLLVPNMVRQKIPYAKIGFFLHVPFPSLEVFRCLTIRKELLEGLLGANLIGFQISEYARHFLQTCGRLLCVKATNDGVQLQNRFVNVISVAIGIDTATLDNCRADPAVSEWLCLMKKHYRGKKLIIARDELDPINGIRSKLLAFELFLNKHPQWRGRVIMVQVAISNTKQEELDATVFDIVTRINSTWANLTYQPMVYLKQDITNAQYLMLLTIADTWMITSQREGMNLTSHEYISCQDGRLESCKKYGALILSEFTGTASLFGGNELTVNPWDFHQCANAIQQALEMQGSEKKARWDALSNVVKNTTAEQWLTAFLRQLDMVYEEQQSRDITSIPCLNVHALQNQYQRSTRRLFVLNYEGTFASWRSPTNVFLGSPLQTIDILNDIISDSRNIVYVMSGCTPAALDQVFIRVPKLGFVAENGCFLREFGSSGNSKWTEIADSDKNHDWMDPIEQIMGYYQERNTGSWIETERHSLIWHYRNADDLATAAQHGGHVTSLINDACEEQQVRAIPINGAVSVEPVAWSKATAAERILGTLKNKASPDDTKIHAVDFLLVFGIGRSDEVVFQWGNDLERSGEIKNFMTVSLGDRDTQPTTTLSQGVTGNGFRMGSGVKLSHLTSRARYNLVVP